MDGDAFLAWQFDLHHERLWALARRLLGSGHEAEEALSAARAAAGLGGIDSWLAAVVARVCVERLRTRAAGAPQGPSALEPDAAALADGTGLALFVALHSLTPDERLALVLYDLFALPLPEVARLTGRTTTEAARLVRGARRRVRGGPAENGMRPVRGLR
ncbi:RNA polymerase sigma factor [Streptomyces sp. NPDC058579]|uniref:RNA polymerase sigma factor n=1 Tax=Streptomyces sp. NPDC058579 TaxID=3346548 RepID=UPI0036675A2D